MSITQALFLLDFRHAARLFFCPARIFASALADSLRFLATVIGTTFFPLTLVHLAR
jgi:hypothetical protein